MLASADCVGACSSTARSVAAAFGIGFFPQKKLGAPGDRGEGIIDFVPCPGRKLGQRSKFHPREPLRFGERTFHQHGLLDEATAPAAEALGRFGKAGALIAVAASETGTI